jgi:Protein of unknown function (DUF4231)
VRESVLGELAMTSGIQESESVSASGEAYLSHPAWLRLEDQRQWYDRKSNAKQMAYKGIKLLQMFVAAIIPLVALVDHAASKWVAGGCGALIAVLEGAQQLGQYQFLWITYRSTAEHLKHERALFLAAAGPYRDLAMNDRLVLLAERVEERVSTEHATWFDESHKLGTRKEQKVRS